MRNHTALKSSIPAAVCRPSAMILAACVWVAFACAPSTSAKADALLQVLPNTYDFGSGPDAATTASEGVTGSLSTPVERFGGIPDLSFTTASQFNDVTLSFSTLHNHNFNYDLQYNVTVDLLKGGNLVAVLGIFLASNASNEGTLISYALPDIGSGAYDITFTPSINTGNEYFAVGNVSLTGTVPEPASIALLATGLVVTAAVGRRRKII